MIDAVVEAVAEELSEDVARDQLVVRRDAGEVGCGL
jgi:hypothetical protein